MELAKQKKQQMIDEFREMGEKAARPKSQDEIVSRDRDAGTLVRKVYVDRGPSGRPHRGIELIDDPARPAIRAIDDPRDLAEATKYAARLDQMVADEPEALAELAAAERDGNIYCCTVHKHHPDFPAGWSKVGSRLDAARMRRDRIDDAKALRFRVWALFPGIDPRPACERPRSQAKPERKAFRFIRKMLA